MISHDGLIYIPEKIIHKRQNNNDQSTCSRILIKSTDIFRNNLVLKLLIHDGMINKTELEIHRNLSDITNANKYIPLYNTSFKYIIDESLLQFCELPNSFLNSECTIIVMSYINGEQIQDYLCKTQNNIPSDDKWELIYQGIKNSIEFLHDNKIVHGDLNHQNLLITKSFEIYILDFEKSKYSNNSKDYTAEKSFINTFKQKNSQY